MLKRRHTRPAGFKGNKVVVDRRQKKTADPDVTVDSPQFQLLVRLYVPAQLLIKNNRVSRKQLGAYLPVVVPGAYAELNFEIHIFLSCIVTSYVSTWYSRLNSDNFDVVSAVYTTLCDFVQAVSGRASSVAHTSLVSLANEAAAIVERHIADNTTEIGVPNYAKDMLERARWSATDADMCELRRRYLSHASFEPAPVGESACESIPDESRLLYFRALAHTLLRATFGPEGPNSSVILTNLLCVVLGDLVLEKTVSKLSSPQFILGAVRDAAAKAQSQPSPKEQQPLWKKAEGAFRSMCSAFETVVSAWKAYRWDGTTGPSVLYSPVWSLANTLCGISHRRGVVAQAMLFMRALLFAGSAGPKLDSLLSSILTSRLHQSAAVDDAALASTMASLRDKLFGNSGPNSEKADAELAPATVANEIWEASTRAHLPQFLAYSTETPAQMKQNIESVLQIFEDTEMNELLVLKLLDCVVMHMYPETTEPVVP